MSPTKTYEYESKKLHYRKYLYKLRINNDLSSIFRTEHQRVNKLSYARNRIDECQSNIKHGHAFIKRPFSESRISLEDLRDAKTIYKYLLDSEDHLIRCEWNTLMIYTNNMALLSSIIKELKVGYVELWKPKKEYEEYLQNNINTIIVNKSPEFNYKVTFGRKKPSKELASWLENNASQVKATAHLIDAIRQYGYIQGLYVYTKNEKTLLLLQMIASNNISRIDKLIYDATIDK